MGTELGQRHGVARGSTRCGTRHARCAAPFRADEPPSPLPHLPVQPRFTCSDAVPSRIALRQLRNMGPLAMKEIVAREGAQGGTIYLAAFSPDGNNIVSGSEDNTIKVWDSGAFWAPNRPSLAKTDDFWLPWQVHSS